MVESNIYIINLLLNFDISSIFNIKDSVIYRLQHHIPDDSFETFISLPLSST
jgi:hypothetical protein